MSGMKNLSTKFSQGWLDFDVVVATPDMMGQVGRLGRILGSERTDAKPQNRYCYHGFAKAVKNIQSR